MRKKRENDVKTLKRIPKKKTSECWKQILESEKEIERRMKKSAFSS